MSKNVVVFSGNRETESIYLAFAAQGSHTLLFKEKNKTALQSLMEQKFDLIIMEVINPVMSEIEFVDQVYSASGGLPIVLVSSYFYDTKDIVFGTKIAEFILKPLKIEELIFVAGNILRVDEALAGVPKPVTKKETKIDEVLHESKKLSVLLEISRSLNSITDFELLLQHIIELAAETLAAERATLFIVDKKTKELWSRTGIGIKSKEIRFPMDRGIAGEVAMSGQVQIIDEPYQHPKFNKEVDLKTGFVTKSLLCLPMKNFQGEVIGVFQILNKKAGKFTKEDELFLSAMAGSTGIAIENALLHDELKKQLDEVKKSYEELYIAQNQILKEAKLSAVSELYGHLLKKEEMEKNSSTDIIAEIKRLYKFDPQLNKFLDGLEGTDDAVIDSVKSYLDDLKGQLFGKK